MMLTECGRAVDAAKSARFVEENIRQVVLSVLIQKPTSAHGVVSAIFCKHGVLVSSRKVDSLLDSLGGEGLVAKTKDGIVTVYSATDQAKASMSGTNNKTPP